MVGPTPGSDPQPAPPSTAADEALKRNTDCVYFLASPLTCKKGSECEYRHSEVARLNPRDCYFWLHGNCLNPKCSFRHPPLDGLAGTQTPAPTPAGPSLPQSQSVSTTTAHVPNAPSKQGVPCIFFQKGFCLKGDWCPFLHGPNFMSNKASPMPETASAAEPTNFKKSGNGLEKFAQDKKAAPINTAKPVKVSGQVKPAIGVEPSLVKNEFSMNKRVTHASGVNEFPGYRSSVPSVTNGNPRVQQPYPLDEPGSMSYKDAEEFSREPSPGFDVLVDDERRDSDYYHSEDQFGISREHEEVRNEYNIGNSTDYDTIAEVGSERHQDVLGYDSHEHFRGQRAWEHRASSGRISGGSSYPERRQHARTENLGQVDVLDLRHRLAKHKKANGLRSVINHEHVRDRHAEDRSYQGFHREEHVSRHENSLGGRLRGRLRIPGRSPSPTDRDIIRNRGRLSPVRAISSHQGRIQDRIKGKVEESFSNDGKNHRDSYLRHTIDDNPANFAAPKSLAELKNKKITDPSRHHLTDQQSLGKRKHLVLDSNNDHQQSGADLSFEGPKPLHEILKRKRGETSGGNSSNNEETADDNNHLSKGRESVSKTETEVSSPYGLDSIPPSIKLQADDGTNLEDGVDQEAEAAYQQGDGESDYEQVGGEEFEMYNGENGDAEEEEVYHDEDDDDDFAKKMGVMYSEA